jgi:acyl dehydratase
MREEESRVAAILAEVRERGDAALLDFSERFDGLRPDPLRVPPERLAQAWDDCPEPLRRALDLAHDRILDFHRRQMPADLAVVGPHGERLGRRWRPVQRAGIYVPGGRASYPSTVLMNAIPARVAGVERLVMVTPPGPGGEPNATVLAAAHRAGVEEVVRVGGAQAIGALAYGTETIPAVDVITGPGNAFVAEAKRQLYGMVGIDMVAGPSEVLVIADGSGDPDWTAIDLFAQATGDFQWIHVDVARAQKESPYGGTIAHGFLTLSLLPEFMAGAMHIADVRMGVNYGLNRVRFPAPVPVDSRLRGHLVLQGYKPLAGGAEIVLQVTVEREGHAKPVCVAESVTRRYVEPQVALD